MNKDIEKWFEDEVEMIEIDEVEAAQSKYGNTFSVITRNQIEELLNGKVVYISDEEYGHFVKLKSDDV